MKRKMLIVCLLGCMCAVKVNAQLQKGNVLVGATLANFNIGLNAGNAFNINITPQAAWFIKDGLAVGAYINLGASGSKGTAPTTTYGFGGLGRYYVNDPNINLTKKTRFFLEVNVGFQGINVSELKNNTNGLGFGFGPGIAHFVTPNIGLEVLLKYNGVAGFGSSAYQNNLNLSFGFQIYLPGKKAMAALKGK
jgi:hypothetical protein